MKRVALVLGLSAVWLSAPASAHFNLEAPPPNTTTTDGGMGSPPCGVGMPSGMITPAQGGHAITVKINEYVAHTGFYRIALALNSPSELPLDNVVKDSSGNILPPSGMPKGTSATAEYENPPVFPVLQDHLFQHNGTGAQTFQMDIVLPNVNCDKCTLQVLEFMAGHGFNAPGTGDTGPGGGYFYRHCADLKITADPSMPLMGTGGAGGGSAGGAPATGGAPASMGGAPANGGSGGVSSATGGSAGGSAVGGAGGQAAAGAHAGGAADGGSQANAAGNGAAATGDSGGCSVSLARESGVLPIASLGLGLLSLFFRKRRRSASAPR
jgi:hypothetical protein